MKKPQLVSQEVFVPSPGKGVAVTATSHYASVEEPRLRGTHTLMTRSDTADVSYVRESVDNGRTWSAPQEVSCEEQRPDGTLRRHPRGGYVDPMTNRYITLTTEGVLPDDEPLQGMQQWYLIYGVSEDGGRTEHVREQIIHEGEEFDAEHHLPGVWRGRNCVMLGDYTCRPITRSDGVLLLPCQISPTGPNGRYHNPGGGLTYTDAALLHGRWRPDGGLSWTLSERVAGDPRRSTRGMIEPTIAALEGDRIIMVMRGSNDKRPHLPGYRWVSFSEDGGSTWSPPQPWTYTDGRAFFSPSSCSQLVTHSSGRLFWLGNVCDRNPRGNLPRYPMMMGEVDKGNGRLIRDSVAVIDDRRPEDAERVTLSNFMAREDRETGQVVLHLSRLFAQGAGDWTADANLYRIAVE